MNIIKLWKANKYFGLLEDFMKYVPDKNKFFF